MVSSTSVLLKTSNFARHSDLTFKHLDLPHQHDASLQLSPWRTNHPKTSSMEVRVKLA